MNETRGPWIGKPLPRIEDERLLQGQGKFTDDIVPKKLAHMLILRAQRAHANIRSIDTARAAAMPGVVCILTGADYKADGFNSLPLEPNPASMFDVAAKVFNEQGERPVLKTPQWPLATGRVRYPGEAVAVAVAETLAQARDALEAIEVEYEDLPSVTTIEAATAKGAPLIWDEAPDNIAFEDTKGDNETAEKALAAAHVVVERSVLSQRIAGVTMEPRGGIGEYDSKTGVYTLTGSSQGVHRIQGSLMAALGEPAEKVRCITHDTGGGFGTLSNTYPEQVLMVWAARRSGRTVKWISDRTETFLIDYHGRDLVTKARLGFDKDGRIVAQTVDITCNEGAQTISYVQLHNAYRLTPTVYRVPVAGLTLRGVVTNTVPIGVLRGAGRPEATLAIERCIDLAADRLGIDRIELRKRNLVTKKELPWKSAVGLTYDSGDFVGNMKKALEACDWKGFGKRKRDAAKRGRLAGIGLANFLESPGGAPVERADISVSPNEVQLTVGTQSTGQGHETSFAQVLADMIGCTPFDVRFVSGDTVTVKEGGGTHSDRSMRLAGAMIVEAGRELVGKAKTVAAALLEVPETEIVFEEGLFVASDRNRRLSIFDIAEAIETGNAALPKELRKTLTASARMFGRIPAYPTGCAVAEVEIDPETGQTEITRYTSVDDAGQPINPLILHGQVHGGVALGVGQALFEDVRYDPENGQVLSASFMDYAMP
ncbi:MAG: xanthine dehydrogenase family protein, partial [Hyphomicrobiales bacterium]|nr:xanthine dehydrogenase family protein [Hyphomicrobiales bacterium]